MDNNQLAGRLKFLKGAFEIIADELYHSDGTPNLDCACILSSEQPHSALIPSRLPRIAVDGRGFFLSDSYQISRALQDIGKTRAFSEFIGDHGITHVARFAEGRSCGTLLGWRQGDEIPSVVRVPTVGGADIHTRIKAPIVLPAEARLELWDGASTEILPYVPVLPNRQLLGWEPLPGHNTMRFGAYTVVTAHGEVYAPLPDFMDERFESCLLDLLTVMRTAGFNLTSARDMGLKHEGTPVFVDPDTVKPGKVAPDMAAKTFAAFINELDLQDEYHWFDPPASSPPAAAQKMPMPA